MAVTTWDGSSSTDWNTAANWDTGAVPTSADDVIIPDDSTTANNCTLSATGGNPKNVKSLKIETNGTIVGGGIQIRVYGKDSSGFAVDNDGIISGSLFLEIKTDSATTCDLNGTSGNFNSVIINHASCDATFHTDTTFDGDLTITAGTLKPQGGSTITVAGDVSVASGATFGVSTGSGAHSFGSLTVASGGTFIATSGTTTITSEASSGYAIEFSGTYTHNNGTLKITTDANTLVKILDDVNHLIIEAATATRLYEWVNNTTVQGDLTINAGRFAHYSPNFSLDVQGDCTINNTGILDGGSGSIELGSLTIASGGEYRATTGTTTITSNTATGTRSVYNNGGTFTHNNGTLKIDTSANTNYDFDGDDLYNFTVECEDGSGALNCDGEASTAVTVLNDLDIKMGILRTNANSFTIHGNVFVRETSLTNKNKFVAQGANQTVKGIITVEDGAFFDMQNQGSGSFGTLTTGGIRVL